MKQQSINHLPKDEQEKETICGLDLVEMLDGAISISIISPTCKACLGTGEREIFPDLDNESLEARIKDLETRVAILETK